MAIAGAAVGVVAAAPPAAAHGFGGRSDLPLPVWMFAYGASAALLISFVGLAVFWRTPRLDDGTASAALAPTSSGWARAVFVAGRALGLGTFLVVLGAAAFGTTTTTENLAPVFVYVVFWVGITVVSALVGDVWRLLNPFDTLAAGVERLRGRPPGPRPDAGSGRGSWPAVAGLSAFLWLELVYPDRAEPRMIAIAIVVYTVAMLVGAARQGRSWLARGEAFTAFFGLLAHMGPLFVSDGRLRIRAPLAGLATMERPRGTEALVLVALGSTTFDGVSRTQLWSDFTGELGRWPLAGVSTLALAWSVAMVALIYVGAMRLTARLFDRRTDELAGAFVHSLVPIVFAYAVAHYFSLLVFEGQGAIALISDPFGEGWDLLGTASRAIDFSVLSATTIAYVQAGAIVAGHVAGVVLAHDRALALFPPKEAARSQYPLLAAMILFTVTGLALLLGT